MDIHLNARQHLHETREQPQGLSQDPQGGDHTFSQLHSPPSLCSGRWVALVSGTLVNGATVFPGETAWSLTLPLSP